MNVKSLKLNNFRNYESAEIEFKPGINLVVGLNGQGKTNLVEALVFLSRAKSPRTHQDKDLIKFDSKFAQIQASVNRSYGEVNFDFLISKETDNDYKINSNSLEKVSQVFGNLACVYFCPQDLEIVSGGPAERRDFIDTDICMLSEAYYNLLGRFEKVLAQRNKLLKLERDPAKIIDTIGVWDEQLSAVSAPIIKTRKAFIEKLAPKAAEFLKIISDEKEDLKISYVGAKSQTKDEIKTEILKALDENLSRDMELGYTTIGPHRDDIKFELNGVDARAFSSQGQKRSIALALKLAEMKIITDEIGEPPIMIFDDVFSELDFKRQKKLYEALVGVQAIFTGTNFKFKPENFCQIKIENGKIKTIKKK